MMPFGCSGTSHNTLTPLSVISSNLKFATGPGKSCHVLTSSGGDRFPSPGLVKHNTVILYAVQGLR